MRYRTGRREESTAFNEITLEWSEADMVGNVSFETARTDHRHSKTYTREVCAGVLLQWPKARGEWPFQHPGKRIAEALGASSRVELGSSWARSDSYWGAAVHVFLPPIKAIKPSQIVSEKAAWQTYELTPEDVAAAVQEGVRQSLAAATQSERLKRLAVQATQVRDWAAGWLDKEARQEVRYTQRLTALKAELKAEVEVQAVQQKEAMRKLLQAGEPDLPAQALELGLKKGAELAVRTAGRSFHFGHTAPNILPAEFEL